MRGELDSPEPELRLPGLEQLGLDGGGRDQQPATEPDSQEQHHRSR